MTSTRLKANGQLKEEEEERAIARRKRSKKGRLEALRLYEEAANDFSKG